MRYFSADLELEQPWSNHQTPDSLTPREEIISVGICVGDSDGNILCKKNIYIEYGLELSAFIKQLTGIKNEQLKRENGAMSILEAWAEMVRLQKEFDTSRVILEWGAGDFATIKPLAETQSFSYDSPIFENPFGRSGLNVKHLHRTWCEANGVNSSGGLAKALGRHGLGFKGQKHDAADDAYNTYRLYLHLMGKMKDKK